MSSGRRHDTPCPEVIASLNAYVDGEVGAEEFRVIALHIFGCPPCEQEERVHRTVKALVVRAFVDVSAPADLSTRVSASLALKRLESPREG